MDTRGACHVDADPGPERGKAHVVFSAAKQQGGAARLCLFQSSLLASAPDFEDYNITIKGITWRLGPIKLQLGILFFGLGPSFLVGGGPGYMGETGVRRRKGNKKCPL